MYIFLFRTKQIQRESTLKRLRSSDKGEIIRKKPHEQFYQYIYKTIGIFIYFFFYRAFERK